MTYRVLIVSSYPIDNPTSGGQKRAAAICEAYRKADFEVRYVAVYHPNAYTERGEDHILMGEEKYLREFDEAPFAGDIIAGECIDKDIHVRSAVAKIIYDFKPHVVQFEQVFVYAGLSRLLRDMDIRPYLVLSSHNIEYEMKREIYADSNVDQKLASKYLRLLKRTEREASAQADLVVAVSGVDARVHRKLGARRTVVVPNGIYRAHTTKTAIAMVRKRLKEHNITKPVLYVASLHPPNVTGFEKNMGTRLDFLPEGSAVVLVGGVAEYFAREEKRITPRAKVLLLGRVEEDILGAAIELSDTIILPISSGGGSNLKTAEALSAGKKIVATDFAFRGFEKYRKLPNIFIAGTPERFRELLAEVIAKDVRLTTRQLAFSRKVEWQTALVPLVKTLRLRLRIHFGSVRVRELLHAVVQKGLSLKVRLGKR